MYSSEIEAFINERNGELTMEECNLLMDIKTNTQIKSIKCVNNEYHIATDDGYCFVFTVR